MHHLKREILLQGEITHAYKKTLKVTRFSRDEFSLRGYFAPVLKAEEKIYHRRTCGRFQREAAIIF